MKKVILLIALVSVFLMLSGCYAKQYKEAKEAEKMAEEHLAEVQKQAAQVESQYQAVESTGAAEHNYPEADETKEVRTVSTSDGGSVGFGSKGDYRDTKVGESCDFEQPFTCAEYIARDGVLYLNLRYTSYASKIEDVTLSLDGYDCDPVGSFMEPGQIEEYTCYLDDSDVYTGQFELTYYHNIDRETKLRTGKITAKNV